MMDDVAALADFWPGPLLAAALGQIDPAHVPNNDLLPLLAAQSRQAAHEAARLLGVIAEVVRATPTFGDSAVDRLDHPVPHAADEVRAALAWSRRAAERECLLAEQLVHEMPEVYAAFLAGVIDRPKVRVFADHLAGLTEAQIATVCEVLLPTAGRFTPGQLVVRLADSLRQSIRGTTSAATARRCVIGRCAPGWTKPARPCSVLAACLPPRPRQRSNGST